MAPKSLVIRAQRRDKHNRNLTHSSKTMAFVVWANQTTDDLSRKNYVLNFFRKLICVFVERVIDIFQI